METPKPTDTSQPASEIALPKEGDILAGKYRIERILGQGGMGVVVAAQHTTLRQKVAIKFLLKDAAKGGDATERFLREARAAVSIQSEHVARVTDVGTLDTGAPYMVMELLTGSDLDQVLESRGSLPVDEAVDYLLQACEAIAEAHSLSLIHRDLKPANLFLTSRADGSPLVKVLDFGLSKATKPEAMDASLTAVNVLMGSPYYMSPEQIRSFKAIDARSDIWSLGVILYQLLTGKRPFEGESLGGLFIAIGGDPVPSIRELNPEIPEALEAAILHCLEKDPKKRTQTVAQLAKEIAPFGAETSRTSLDRILRVLSDPSASPAVRDRQSRTGPVPPVAPTSNPGLAHEPKATPAPSSAVASGGQGASGQPGAMSSAGVALAVSAARDAGTPAPRSVTVSGDKAAPPPVASGSMSAIAVNGPDRAAAPAEAPRPKGAGMIIGAVVGVAVVAAGVFFGLRGTGNSSGSGSGAAATTTTPGPSTEMAATSATPAPPPPTQPAAPSTTVATPAETVLPTAPGSAAPSLTGRLPKPGASATASSSAAPVPTAAASVAPTAATSVAPTANASASAATTPATTASPASSPTATPVATSAPAAPTPPPPATTAPSPPPPPPAPAPAPPKTEGTP